MPGKNVLRVSVLAIVLALGFSVACERSSDFVSPPIVTGPVIVAIQSAQSQYDVGETLTIEVTIDNARNVGSIPFHLRFDENILRFLPPAEEGPFMGAGGTATVFLASENPIGGEIVVGLSRMGTPRGADGAGVLVTLHFDAVGAGSSSLQFTGASVKDPQAMNLSAVFNTKQITVQP